MRYTKIYRIAKIIDKLPRIKREIVLGLLYSFNPEFISRGGIKEYFQLSLTREVWFLK